MSQIQRRRSFLTAEWKDLILVTYEVEPAVLEHRLTPNLELDTIDGRAFVSLVAFDFLETAVLGIKWPGFVNFPEINLRFYVREKNGGRRGVMFVRELVPSRLVAWIARAIYNEPYSATWMRSSKLVSDDTVTITHDWKWRGESQRLVAVSDGEATMPADDSTEHFFKEHQWGFGVTRSGRALEYEVNHPHWKVHNIRDLELDVDFGSLYGEEFAALNDAEPYSVVHAVGSEISVSPHN